MLVKRKYEKVTRVKINPGAKIKRKAKISGVLNKMSASGKGTLIAAAKWGNHFISCYSGSLSVNIFAATPQTQGCHLFTY